MNDSDLELLARYARHHAEDAFAELVRRHLDLVHSAALRQVRSPQLAEEVAQATFIKLARQAQPLAPGTILAAWLYQVARRESIDVVRREARRQLREQVALEMHTMNDADAEWRHIEPLLDEAMHALDDTDRAAVILRYFENKTFREVGGALGTSDDTAQKRVSRAVERLREFFAKRGVKVGASGLGVVLSANAVQASPIGMAATISTGAVLAGATFATTPWVTATKSMLMTTLQKAILATIVVAAVTTAVFLSYPTRVVQPASGTNNLPTAQMPSIAGATDYDISKVHPMLRELSLPVRSVGTFVSRDEGIGMTIIDGQGRKLGLGLAVSPNRSPKYEITFGPRTETPLTEDTRRMLVSVLAQHRNATGPSNKYNDQAYRLLTNQ